VRRDARLAAGDPSPATGRLLPSRPAPTTATRLATRKVGQTASNELLLQLVVFFHSEGSVNHRWITSLVAIGGCLILACSNNDLKRRVLSPQVLDVAEPGVSIETVVEAVGEPHQRNPNDQGGERILYKTYFDWDKFIAHYLVWIDTDQNGQIVKVDSEIDPD
jgi:hypothetical protein